MKRTRSEYPGAAMIATVRKIDERVEALAHGTTSEKSVGGMTSKLAFCYRRCLGRLAQLIVQEANAALLLAQFPQDAEAVCFITDIAVVAEARRGPDISELVAREPPRKPRRLQLSFTHAEPSAGAP